MLQYKLLDPSNSQAFQDVFRIYIESFPDASERMSEASLMRKLNSHHLQIWVAFMEDQIISLAMIYPFQNVNLTLLAYFATDQNFRGQGVGTQFLQFLIHQYRALILEVEHPNFGENQVQRKQRIAYYRRLGAREFKNIRYILPALSDENSTEMILMKLPALPNQTLAGQIVKAMIEELYLELYDQPAENNQLLQVLMAQSFPEKVELI
jgi:GNAT superfamily N-acetyltransferase